MCSYRYARVSDVRLRVLPAFGDVRLSDIRRIEVQDFVDRLLASGFDPSTINTTLHPPRAIFRRARTRGDLAVSPTSGLDLPATRGRRERFASPTEAEALILAAPETDRATWATALCAGLRQGELRGLRVEDVDLATGVIRVERGWDRDEGAIELKSNRVGARCRSWGPCGTTSLTTSCAQAGRGSELIFGRLLPMGQSVRQPAAPVLSGVPSYGGGPAVRCSLITASARRGTAGAWLGVGLPALRWRLWAWGGASLALGLATVVSS
jgi:Phage integrase, N-terminal SAM-like domain